MMSHILLCRGQHKKAESVPGAGLLGKLEHYGIDSKILLWITNFLNNRKQRVVVDGSFLDKHFCSYLLMIN